MRFLDESGFIHIDQAKRIENSETRKISQIVDSFNGSPQYQFVLNHYRMLLLNQVENDSLSIRTARLYLRAAASLMEKAIGFPPSQNDIQRYLNKKPGQKASLTRFVSYVNSEWDIELGIPLIKRKKQRSGNLTSEKRLIRLLKTAGESASYNDERILAAAMEYYHGIPEKMFRTFKNVKYQKEKTGGFVCLLGDNEYWLPVCF